MTPEDAKQWLDELVSRMEYRENGYLNSDQNAYNRGIAEHSQSKTQQAAALIERQAAQLLAAGEQLRGMRELMSNGLVGGNHLASWLVGQLGTGDEKFPPYNTEYSQALQILPPNTYDVWICWAELMRQRDKLELCTPTDAEAGAKTNAEKAALLDSATRFKVGKRKGYDVTVETREGHDGPKWAVFDGCFVLDTGGQWEHEPLPSSRTEEFLGRTRFDSLTDALRAAREASDE